MSVFSVLAQSPIWTTLKSWTFPWTGALPAPLDQDEKRPNDLENNDQEQEQAQAQKVNRDA